MKNIYLIVKILRDMRNHMINKLNKIELIIDPLYQLKKTCKLLNDVDKMAHRLYDSHLENGCLMGDLFQYKYWISKACMPFKN